MTAAVAAPTGSSGQTSVPSTDPASVEAPRGRRVGLGFVDVAGSSLASFSLGVFATRFLPGDRLGLYALFFTAFLLGAVVPAQLLCTPAEIEAVYGPPERQFCGLRSLAPRVLGLGGLTALFTTLAIGLTVGHGRAGFVPLAVTMVLTSALSPLQDHVRRLSHQANASAVAATMSMVQAATTGFGLLVLGRPEVLRAAAPFGALLAANVLSTIVGLTLLRRRGLPLSGQRPDLRRLAQTGRWLTAAGVSQAFGGLGALLIISRLAGVEAAGFAEAVRVLSQPVYVVAVGLLAVMNPAIFRARLSGATALEGRVHRHYKSILLVCSLALLVGSSRLNPWNPLVHWFPTAYAKPGLLEGVIIAQLLAHWPLTKITSLLAEGRVAEATMSQVAGFPVQLMLSALGGALGAWAFFLSFFGAAVSRMLAISTLERRGQLPVLTRYLTPGGRDVGEDKFMKDVHPLEEPSLLKAIRRRPLVFAACTLAGLALGVGAASRSADTYSGSSAVTVEDPRLTSIFVGSPALDAKRYVADQVQVLQSPQVLQLAAAALDGKAWGPITYDDVVAGLSVQGADTSNTITVSFAAATADLATAGTDAVVDAYIAVATDNAELAESKSVAELQTQVAAVDAQVSQIDQEIDALQLASAGAPGSSRDVRLDAALSQRNGLLSERSALSARSRQLAVDLARNPSGVTRRTTAFATEVPSGAARFGFLGLLLGGVLGTVLTYRLARRRRRFETVREPETVLGVRFLAAIPARGQGPTTAALERSREAVMEFLATFIEAEARRSGLQRVGFVSPSASIELGHLGSGLQRTLSMERSEDDSVLRNARVTLSGGEQRPSEARDDAPDGGLAPLSVGSSSNGSNGSGARRLSGKGMAGSATAAVHSEGGALVTEAVAGGDVGGRRAALPVRQPSTERAERSPELDTLSGPSVVAGPPTTSPEQSESLVLVEIPGRSATSGASTAQDSIDAIVLVLDANESIAAAAEVTRRVEVLGWNLLGYVYVTGSRPR